MEEEKIPVTEADLQGEDEIVSVSEETVPTLAKPPLYSVKKILFISLILVAIVVFGLIYMVARELTSTIVLMQQQKLADVLPQIIRVSPPPTPYPTTAPTIEPKEAIVVSPDNRYTNESLEISFRYPEGWGELTHEHIEGNLITTFVSLVPIANYQENDFVIPFRFSYYNQPQNLTVPEFQEYLSDQEYPQGTPVYYSENSQELTYGDITGYYLKDAHCSPLLCDIFTFSYNGKIYIFKNVYQEDIVNSQRIEFEKILESLEFLSTNQSGALITTDEISMDLPEGFSLIEELETALVYGEDPIRYLTITKKYSVDLAELEANINPDYKLLTGTDWGQENNVVEIEIDGVKAKSFYVGGYGPDNAWHIVQTDSPKYEFKMYVAGGGLDQKFKDMLQTVKFNSEN